MGRTSPRHPSPCKEQEGKSRFLRALLPVRRRRVALGETRTDERLYRKEYVVGLVHNDVIRAYPFGVLNETPVVNDTVGGEPVVVTFDAGSGGGIVFSREVGGQTLTFQPISEEDPNTGLLHIQDNETQTRWLALTGEAVEGELAGKTLRQIPTTLSFWFGWKDFYPRNRNLPAQLKIRRFPQLKWLVLNTSQ